jgi:5,10-methylene-tetrahydrofolate dehydrogenase/methenyl tetrahydrofolate cyclohydrolase
MSVNHTIDQSYLRQLVYDADVIMSCTGVVHLVDHTRLRDDQTQYIIDIGRGTLDGQAVGDVRCDDALIAKVAGYTPIP